MSETSQDIHKRILSNIDNRYDRSEGSFFYDTTKPTAIECESLTIKADEILKRGFASTANGKDLDKRCSEKGIERKLATKAINEVTIKGLIGAIIKRGDLVASNSLNFVCMEDKVIGDTGEIIIKVECEQFGSVGNIPSGAIKYFPRTIEGIHGVVNKEPFINGYDEESDDSLRERYNIKARTPATSGNINHYLQWALECTGVGYAKIFSLAYGAGTVKVIIADSNKRSASKELIDKVFLHIEDNRPIGAKVYVESVKEKVINITSKIVLDNGFNIGETQQDFLQRLDQYLKESFFKTGYQNGIKQNRYLSIAKIGGILLNASGVSDYLDLKINNSTSNINLVDEEIPVIGVISLEV